MPFFNKPEQLVYLFYKEGYLIVKQMFSPDEVKVMKEAVTRLHNVAKTHTQDTEIFNSKFIIDPEHKVCKRVIWAGGIEPILLRYGQDPRILEVIAQLFGRELFVQILNQVHFKTPNDNVGFPLHQDIWNRDKKDDTYVDLNGHGSFIQSIIAIDKMDYSNGGIYFIPRSHLLKRVDNIDHNLVDINQKLYFSLEPGDMVFWSPYLIHGSDPNTSNKSRNSLINGYCLFGANSRVYSGCGTGKLIQTPNQYLLDKTLHQALIEQAIKDAFVMK